MSEKKHYDGGYTPYVLRRGNEIDVPVFSPYGKRKNSEDIGVGDRMFVSMTKYRYKFDWGVWAVREESAGSDRETKVLFFEKISDTVPEPGAILKQRFSPEERNMYFERR